MHSCMLAPRAQSSFRRAHGVTLPIHRASMIMKAEQERGPPHGRDMCTAAKNEGCMLQAPLVRDSASPKWQAHKLSIQIHLCVTECCVIQQA